MKVVLFCGGLGTRLREHSDTIPKPLVNVGYRPLIWHLMRYYAHYGHRDFVLEELKWQFNESELDRTITAWPGAWLKRIR